MNNKKLNYILLYNTVDFILVLLIILFFYLTFEVKSKQVVYIPQGSTSYIIKYLKQKKYNLNIIDKIVLSTIGYPQSGWINLKSMTMTKGDFLYKLTTSKAPLKSVTLIPGETYYFFLNNVAQKLKISKTKLFYFYEKYAFKKDGNILAQTYSLPIGMDEEEFIIYLFNYTNTQYKKYSNKIFGLYNRQNWFKYITIASIIQKESASKDEMKFISSVIHNRIKKNMKLQMDGTLNYGQFSHTKITPQMIREDNSNYNTYKIRNIPNHPICAVEINSIKAAIFPKQTKYLYFMKSSNSNKHIFSKTYNKHKKAITKVMKQKRKKRDIKNLWKFK